MAELLLELFSEEIPARLQARAAEDLRRLIVDGLKARGLEVGRGACVRDAAAAGARRSRTCRRNRRPCRRSARVRASARLSCGAGLPQGGGPQVARRGRDRQGREEGRLLRRAHRQAGPAGGRDRRRGAARGDRRAFPGRRSMRFNGRLDGGAELRWIRPLHSISACSTARSCRSRSPASRPATPRAGIASTATSRSRSRASPTTRSSLKQHKVILDAADARRAHRRAGARARQGGQARARRGRRRCSRRTPASPSGRPCSWASSTRRSSRCRPSA